MAEKSILAGTLLSPETVKPTDYTIAATDARILTYRDGIQRLEDQRERFQFDQLSLPGDGAHACWLVGAMRMLLDAFPLDTPELRAKARKCVLDAWEYAKLHGYHRDGFGGTMADGVDIGRRFYNAAFPDRKLATYRCKVPRFDKSDVSEASFYAAAFHGWSLAWGGYVNGAYVKDAVDDGKVQQDAKPSGAGTYGHLRTLYAPRFLKFRAVDNYPDRIGQEIQGFEWSNAYDLPNLETKTESGQVFPHAYFALPA